MTIPQLIENHTGTGFSFEVLPPLKGKGISQLFKNIDSLKEFNPLYINITTHRSELVYKSTPDGLYQKVTERSRPGTVQGVCALLLYYCNIAQTPLFYTRSAGTQIFSTPAVFCPTYRHTVDISGSPTVSRFLLSLPLVPFNI